jgi:hypothetical protein
MKTILIHSLLVALLFTTQSCEKSQNSVEPEACRGLPNTSAPAGLSGNWASGYSSYTQVVDVYSGKYLGNAWQSGKFFMFTQNGKNAEFYYTASSQYSQTALKAIGSIAFDGGSTAEAGSFTFYACNAHYKGYGSSNVDRDATDAELTNNLTIKYYYKMEGQWLRIEPKSQVNAYSSSFKSVN